MSAVVLATMLGCASSGSREPKPPTSPATSRATQGQELRGVGQQARLHGHALLSRYMELVGLLAQGYGDVGASTDELDAMSEDAAQQRQEGHVDGEFVRRYQRLIRLTKLMLQPAADEESRQAIEADMAVLVADANGTVRPWDPSGGLAEWAPALVEEVVNLHLQLFGSNDREEARQKYLAK